VTTENAILDPSTLLPEINLLLCCARYELSKSQLYLAKEIIDKKINWDLFTKLTFDHGVVPLVYRHLSKHFNTYLPDANRASLRNYVMANTQSNLGLLRELFKITELLKNNNIQSIPFKGLIVAELIYRDLSARKCGDIDIFVKQDDFYKAKNLFLLQGFEQTLSDQTEINCLQSGLFHESRQVKLDLHFGLPPKVVGIKVSKFFKKVSNLSIGNKNISTLSEIDMFLVLCVNATKEYWNQKLYAYCDIQTFLEKRKNMDWNAIIKRADSLRCKRMLFIALLVTHEIYGIPDSPYIVDKINSIHKIKSVKNELIQQLLPKDAANFTSIRGQFCCLGSEQAFFTSLMDTTVIRMKYRIPKFLTLNVRDLSVLRLPRNLFFLYYLIKPFRVLFKRSQELFNRIFS